MCVPMLVGTHERKEIDEQRVLRKGCCATAGLAYLNPHDALGLAQGCHRDLEVTPQVLGQSGANNGENRRAIQGDGHRPRGARGERGFRCADKAKGGDAGERMGKQG